MKNHAPAYSLLALAIIVSLAATPAYAKHDDFSGHGKGHKDRLYEESFKQGTGHKHAKAMGGFDDSKKASVRAYLLDSYTRDCPPGLAKKHNGCLPPGQAKKYSIGGFLPHDHRAPPAAIIELLGPPPAGAFYAMVDEDVVLAAEGTKKILDAITLFSAIH